MMAEPLRLTPGVEQAHGTPHDEEERVKTLRLTAEKYLPDLCKAVREQSEAKKFDLVTLHQDAFAAGYHADEYTLLGVFVKYAGLYGVPVMISGKNHETF